MTKSTIGLFLLATTFLSSPVCAGAAVPITDDTEKNVVRGYEEATQDDYDFSLSEADAEGRPSTKYYKINLNYSLYCVKIFNFFLTSSLKKCSFYN